MSRIKKTIVLALVECPRCHGNTQVSGREHTCIFCHGNGVIREEIDLSDALKQIDVNPEVDRSQGGVGLLLEGLTVVSERVVRLEGELADAIVRAEKAERERDQERELMEIQRDLAVRETIRAEAAEAKLAAVPVEALRWIDHARTSGTWSSIEGPPAYAALHSWLAQQDKVQP